MLRFCSAKWACTKNVRLLISKGVENPPVTRLERSYSQLQNNIYEHKVFASIKQHNRLATDNINIRSQSTQGEALRKRKKRIMKPQYWKYVELLEVTDTSANVRKSRVKRLKAKKLQQFIVRTQAQINKVEEKRIKSKTAAGTGVLRKAISLEMKSEPVQYKQSDIDNIDDAILELGTYDAKPLLFFGKPEYNKKVLSSAEDIQSIIKSFNNYRNMIVESIVSEEVQDGMETPSGAYSYVVPKHEVAEEMIDPLEADKSDKASENTDADKKKRNVKKVEAAVTKKSRPRFKSKIHNSETDELLAKEKALQINLESYLKVCVSAGMTHRGITTLLAYRQRAKKRSETQSLITIDLYNILLHGLAEKGEFQRFEDVFKLIEEDQLNFNEQTYAAIFECLGRVDASTENLQQIKKFMQMAKKNGITLNQIMDRSLFTADQRDVTLDAIRRIEPDFTVIYTPPVLTYHNLLLNKLNEHILPVGGAAADATLKQRDDGNAIKKVISYNKEDLEQNAREQLKIELDGFVTINSIEKSQEFGNAEYCREKLKELEKEWRKQISAAITRDLNILRAQIRYNPSCYMNYYTYLKAIEPTIYTDILLQEIYKLADGSETFSPTIGQLNRELGRKVQQRYLVEMQKKNGTLEKIGEIYSSYCDFLHEPINKYDNPRQIWQRLVHEQRSNGPSLDIKHANWPNNVQSGVGRFLYNILMSDIKIDAYIMRQQGKNKQQNILPAFYTLFRSQSRSVKEEIKPHPVLARLLRASRQQTLTFDSNLVPMLCPPQPWVTPNNGGYLLNKSDLLRLPHQAVQQLERINSTSPQQIYPALDSLNQLAAVPWRVNTEVLDVIINVFQNGGDDKLNVPKPRSALPPLPAIEKDNPAITAAERSKAFKDKLSHRRKQGEMYSLWCETLYRLSLANHFRDRVFWLPHNMDFRGRVYPIPPHLNHLGSDLARSILVFDEAKPLGVDGFSWLKLHCINLTGLKKRDSVHERLLYAEQIMDDILDSADNPLNGRMWWAKSDEPWQTLACCMEIAKVQRSGKPEEFLSRFPIHQDGSCNGLQHYAALGRDTAGAISVNLAPSATPNDVYSAVASLVEKTRKTEALQGIGVAQVLEGFVLRKVIKQTVMTTVYGVTRYGARLQIARQLKDIDEFPREWVWPASHYLTSKTFESLREMFTSTREIQDWFTECARLIAGTCGKNVEWITPLGLPVVQPYNKQDNKSTVHTFAHVPEHMAMDMFERPNIMKQKNAFPPNFIHSLDSSHMMLTSLHCARQGLTFISVHDCFWTHACTVPEMNTICREQFVSLHSQPILEDLSAFMKSKYSFREGEMLNDGSVDDLSKRRLNRVLGDLPKKGDFDLEKILKSVYFFS